MNITENVLTLKPSKMWMNEVESGDVFQDYLFHALEEI